MADKADSKELKSEAKATDKDAESNNAEPDSKQDTKNGQNEEEDESSEDEEHPGLYDKPVVIEGKRARKSTEFLVNTTPVLNKESKPLLFEGKGESLGSIERSNYEIGRCSAGELKPLHKLLYGRDGRVMEVKKNIRKFNGFAFEKDSKDYESKKLGVERFTNDGLKRLCEIFDLEKKGKRSDLLEKVMDFLMSPKSSGRPAPQPKAKKGEKKKRKRTKKDSSKSKTPSKSKKTSDAESGDDADKEDEDDEIEEEEEPPKKKKKVEASPKKAEASPKKAKEKKGKDKGKDKDKSKEQTKSKKTGEKAKSPKKRDPVPVKITALKKASPKKKTPKKEKPLPVDDSSSDEEPLAKKSKKQPPTNSELEKIVTDLLDGADLEQVTMKTVCKQVYDMFPEHDLTSRKDFIKKAVRKVIS